jgi:hypothetical protein
MKITRRVVQVILGLLWVLDGLLQLQPFMFTAGFAQQILSPAGTGQPLFVSGPVALSAALISAHPAVFNLGFALAQLGLGVGMLVPGLVRPALAASVVWSFGVWYLGEGLGGVAGGRASPITGAPGAVLFYLVLAVAAWPMRTQAGLKSDVGLPTWLATAWALLWFEFAVMLVLPGADAASRVADQLGVSGSTSPVWLAHVDASSADFVKHIGFGGVVVVAAACLCIGLAGVGGPRMRLVAIHCGCLFAVVTWAIGQSLGNLFSGQATDPNTGPILVLFGLALLGIVDTSKPCAAAAAALAPQPATLENVRTARYRIHV